MSWQLRCSMSISLEGGAAYLPLVSFDLPFLVSSKGSINGHIVQCNIFLHHQAHCKNQSAKQRWSRLLTIARSTSNRQIYHAIARPKSIKGVHVRLIVRGADISCSEARRKCCMGRGRGMGMGISMGTPYRARPPRPQPVRQHLLLKALISV